MGFGPEGKDAFPFGRHARKEEVELHRDFAAEQRLREESTDSVDKLYAIYDAPLEDNSFREDSTFESTFRYALPVGAGTLRWYIEESLQAKKGKAVGIEFGGPGSALFAGFSKGFFARSLGVTLADLRVKLQPNPTNEDDTRHHEVLEGDITYAQTQERVRKWLAGERADLIVERMEGGRLDLPQEPFLLAQICH